MGVMRISRWLLLVLLLSGLAACKEVLHADLSEDEGNEIVALLLSRNIDARKVAGDKGAVTVMVESADFAAAIEILRDNGYPRDKFSNLGTVFDDQGLISSPLEERARFIFAISQSISETLSQIDGVITARVHVSMPEVEPLDPNPATSSASVFLKTRPGVSLDNKVNEIKMIVQSGVEGLQFDDVSVVLFEASPPPSSVQVNGPALSEFLGIRYTNDSLLNLVIVGGVLGSLLIFAICGNAYLLIERRRLKQRRGGGKNKSQNRVGNGNKSPRLPQAEH